MDKVKLDTKSPKKQIVQYNDITFELSPYISAGEQMALVQRYLEIYFDFDKTTTRPFSETSYDYINAEYDVTHSIIQLLTNIDPETISDEIYASSALWTEIEPLIKNYKEFRNKLERIVSDVKEEIVNKNSLGFVIAGLSDRILSTLNEFSSISPDDIEKVKQSGLDLLKQIESSSAKEVIAEANSLPKKKGKK
jgi:hypothetical protein